METQDKTNADSLTSPLAQPHIALSIVLAVVILLAAAGLWQITVSVQSWADNIVLFYFYLCFAPIYAGLIVIHVIFHAWAIRGLRRAILSADESAARYQRMVMRRIALSHMAFLSAFWLALVAQKADPPCCWFAIDIFHRLFIYNFDALVSESWNGVLIALAIGAWILLLIQGKWRGQSDSPPPLSS